MRIVPIGSPACHLMLTAITCALLAGCSALERKTVAEYQIDAGSVKLSVASIAPWEEVVGDLSPNFKIDGKKAKEAIEENNAALERSVVEKILLALAIAKDGTFPEGLKGATPRKAEEPATTPDQTDKPKKPEGVSLEPMISYKAATALYQEVELLNSYLEHAVIPEGYRPYLVRLQLAVLPHRRNQPFDVITDLQFVPGSELLDSPLRPNRPISEFSLIARQAEENDTLVEDSTFNDISSKAFLELFERIKPEDETDQNSKSNKIKTLFEGAKNTPNLLGENAKRKKEAIKKILINLDKPELYEIGDGDDVDEKKREEEETKYYLEKYRNIALEANEIYETVENIGGWSNALARFNDIEGQLSKKDENPSSRTLSSLANLAPKVVPLLVTDSLETAPERVTQRLIRNLQVLTSGTSGGTPFLANLVSDRDQSDQTLTTDLNSLLAVSQMNDNAVRLRLGARYDAAPNRFEMTARTHNITLLVNVPDPIVLLREQEDRQLRLLALTKMRDARTGELLEDGRQESRELKKSLRELAEEYNLKDHEKGGEESKIFCLGKDGEEGRKAVKGTSIMQKLLSRHVIYNDRQRFSDVVSCMWGATPDEPMSTRDQEMLWAALTSLTPAIPADQVKVPLPESSRPIDSINKQDLGEVFFVGNLEGGGETSTVCDTSKTGSSQSGVMYETEIPIEKTDPAATEEKTVVRFSLAQSIDPSGLLLTLRVPEKPHHIFVAENIEIDGSVLEAHFPSLAKFRAHHGKVDKKAILRISTKNGNGIVKDSHGKEISHELCVFRFNKKEVADEPKVEKPGNQQVVSCPVLTFDERKKLVDANMNSLGTDHFIVMRHADKKTTEQGTDPNKVGLTDTGIRHAEAIGSHLKALGINLTSEQVSAASGVDRTCATATKILAKTGDATSGSGSTCKTHESPLNDYLAGEAKKNGIRTVISQSGQIKEAVDTKPDLACGEAVFVKLEGSKIKCLFRALPHEWNGDKVPLDWPGNKDGKLNGSYWENQEDCKGDALAVRPKN